MWHGFRFHQLVEVPRYEAGAGGNPARSDSGALAAALTAAHAILLAPGSGPFPRASEAGRPGLLTAWVRAPGERRLRLLLAGQPRLPMAASEPVESPSGQGTGTSPERRVMFPPGALAADVSPADGPGLLDAFGWWVPCTARPDALWVPSRTEPEQPALRRGWFDRYVAHLEGPFAWVVLAEPLASGQVRPELDLLSNEILPLSRGEIGAARRVVLERLQAQHRELSRVQAGDAWRVRVLVAGTTEAAAAATAAGLCAVAELQGLPYVVAPTGPPMSAGEAVRLDPPTEPANSHGNGGGRLPAAVGTELLAALARPPERELPGLRLVEPHTFDVTPEQIAGPARGANPREDGLPLGDVLDPAGAPVARLALDRGTLNRHTFVCGATGAGKSQTIRNLLTEAARSGLPWLVVEPAKAEYARMAPRIARYGQDVVVIRPGDPEAPPAGFNPLEPEPGFPLQTHLDLLRALFLAAFESAEPFPQVLATALTRSYEEQGFDLAVGGPPRHGREPRYPTLGDLERVALTVVSDIGYGDRVAADVHGFIKVRLGSLRLGTTGRFFEGGHRLDFARLRGRNVVLEIEDVGDDTDKAFLMGAVLIRLSEHLRVTARRSGRTLHGLTHLTVIEEAHRLLRRHEGGGGQAAYAVELFASMLAEVRAYGEGLIIAEQIPGKLTPDVIKNTAVKVVHRLPAKDDREAVGATMNLDERQARYVVTLRPGYGAVFADGMDRPMLVRMRDGTGDEDRGGGTIAPVAPLVEVRSQSCGADCRSEPCTLRQMREAQHRLAEQPWLRLWAELAVLAHLAGHPVPVPAAEYLGSLAAVPRRELDCAVAHAVDDAVAVRAGQLHPDVSATGLSAHCVAVLRTAITGDGTADVMCADDALGYLAYHLRWLLPVHRLSVDRDADTPHPDTARWERRLGRLIPGRTRAEQQAAVGAWWQAALKDQVTRDTVTFGTRRPSTVECLVSGTPAEPGWDTRLLDALSPFPGCTWPLAHLIPIDRQQRPRAEG